MKCDYRIGDCVEVLKEYPENHFHSCVTDPPYGLEFMGKAWDRLQSAQFLGETEDWQDDLPVDHIAQRMSKMPRYHAGKEAQAWHTVWAAEVLRVLKPGAMLLAFGGTRTYHRMTCALEDAGFEIRDCMMWLYGSGFPKSYDISKGIDKKAGVVRAVIGVSEDGCHNTESSIHKAGGCETSRLDTFNLTAPATQDAIKWQGWGTALKPAYEPIVVCRKPLIGTVVDNILKHGTGGINVDGCRIEVSEEAPKGLGGGGVHGVGDEIDNKVYGKGIIRQDIDFSNGRWPSNLLLDQDSAKLVDEQSGVSESKPGLRPRTDKRIYGTATGVGELCEFPYDDFGGASRFFYTAKASRSEREKGLEKRPSAKVGVLEGRQDGSLGGPIPVAKNFHPTVKPLDLMQYLVRLVTPKGGICLDPFLGSGTTMLACRLEGFAGLGIEKNPEYEPIIKGRMEYIPPALDTFEEGKVSP